MPSGHMQVTVAVYTILSVVIARRWFTSLVTGIVILTAISRVHMGAHTPFQVSCGLASGLLTAYAVMSMGDAIRYWSARQIGAVKRVAYAVIFLPLLYLSLLSICLSPYLMSLSNSGPCSSLISPSLYLYPSPPFFISLTLSTPLDISGSSFDIGTNSPLLGLGRTFAGHRRSGDCGSHHL